MKDIKTEINVYAEPLGDFNEKWTVGWVEPQLIKQKNLINKKILKNYKYEKSTYHFAFTGWP